jgi:hypothetical protein
MSARPLGFAPAADPTFDDSAFSDGLLGGAAPFCDDVLQNKCSTQWSK